MSGSDDRRGEGPEGLNRPRQDAGGSDDRRGEGPEGLNPAPRFGRIAEGPTPAPGGESFHTLLAGGGVRVMRIASLAHADPPGEWYDQAEDEFVLLLAGAARLAFAGGAEHALSPGDWAVIPAHCRHRVAWTDPARETLWLALHLPPA